MAEKSGISPVKAKSHDAKLRHVKPNLPKQAIKTRKAGKVVKASKPKVVSKPKPSNKLKSTKSDKNKV